MQRDLVQGFIEGYLATGGDSEKLRETLDAWMRDHPIYPLKDSERAVVLGDLESYRGVLKK